MTSKEKALAICKLLSDKKGENIVYIDVHEKSSLCDYFVIAGGRSSTSVQALADHVEEKMEKEFGELPSRKDGGREGRWRTEPTSTVIPTDLLRPGRIVKSKPSVRNFCVRFFYVN